MDHPTPGTNERQAVAALKDDLLNRNSDRAQAWLPEMHKLMQDHTRAVFKPQIIDAGLTVIPKCSDVQVATNKQTLYNMMFMNYTYPPHG